MSVVVTPDTTAVPAAVRRRAGTYWHGGVPGLRVGDVLTGGHQRAVLDGCPICEARARGDAISTPDGGVLDGPSQQTGVYLTTHRLYAKHYASLWGRGDLYQATPNGDVTVSVEDSFETVVAATATITAVYDRAVLLTNTERRRLFREWGAADQTQGATR